MSSLLCLSAALPHHANAAGFYIQEQSVKGLGSAFAGSVTSIDDASTVYFNPAGMTRLDGPQVNGGVHMLVPSSDLSNNGSTFNGAPSGGGSGGNPYNPTPVPNGFAVMPLNSDQSLWAGIGVTAPFGLANDYGDSWFGRFDSTKTELTTINIQPSLAYKVNHWLSIGAGVDVQYAKANLESVVSDTLQEGTSRLKGVDWSVGYNVGLLLSPTPQTDIGLHYRSAISHELEGRISASGLSGLNPLIPNFNTTGSANLDLPDIATFGIGHDVTPDLRVMAQATWFGWNNYQDITPDRDDGVASSPIVQNYQTTWAFSVGAEYDVNDQWTVRGGYQFDETPTTDQYRTTRTPDGDRNWFSLGATYHWTPDISIDMAATYIDVADGTIDLSRNGGLAQVRGDTDGSVGIVALGLNYKF
jgi:long-chain fatty acid transport protein